MKAESTTAIAELRANAAEFRSTMEVMIEKRLAQIREPADGPRGEPGSPGVPGPPGKIERLNGYVEDAVHYRGDIITHRGSTYQARCDTRASRRTKTGSALRAPAQTVRTDAMVARQTCAALSRLVRAIEHWTLSRLTAVRSLRATTIPASVPAAAGSR